MSQTLARVLAQVCSKKLSTLYSAAEQMQSEQQNQGTSSSNKTSSTSVPSPVPSITPERYIICHDSVTDCLGSGVIIWWCWVQACYSLILFSVAPTSTHWLCFVYSQLICLLPVGFLRLPFVYSVSICSYWPWKAPWGSDELSLYYTS